MRTEKYQGKKFNVTLDRGRMRRRYVLLTIEPDGSSLKQNEPLYREEFEERYGFSPEWPHESVKNERGK